MEDGEEDEEQAGVHAMDQDLVLGSEDETEAGVDPEPIEVDEEMKPPLVVSVASSSQTPGRRAAGKRRVVESSDVEVHEIETDTSEAAASPRSPRGGTTGASSSVLRHGVASTASGSRQRNLRSSNSNPSVGAAYGARGWNPGAGGSSGPSTLPSVEETPTRPRIRSHRRR